jgi:hypothetical protein
MYSHVPSWLQSPRSRAEERETHFYDFDSPDKNYSRYCDNNNIPQATQITVDAKLQDALTNGLNSWSPEQIAFLNSITSSDKFLSLATNKSDKFTILSENPHQVDNNTFLNTNSQKESQIPVQAAYSQFSLPQMEIHDTYHNAYGRGQKGHHASRSNQSANPNSVASRGFTLKSDEFSQLDCHGNQKYSAQFLKLKRIINDVRQIGSVPHGNMYAAAPPQDFYDSNHKGASAYEFLRAFVHYSPSAKIGHLDFYFKSEIQLFLKGTAQLWFDEIADTLNGGFDEFAQIFLQIFGGTDLDDDEIKYKIKTYYQGENETFNDYFFVMLKYFDQLYYALSEYEKIEALLRNVRPEYQDRVRDVTFFSVNELVKKMSQVEQIVLENRKWAERDARNRQNNQTQNRHYNNSYAHPTDAREHNARKGKETNSRQKDSHHSGSKKYFMRAEKFVATHPPSKQTDYENQMLQPPSLPPRDGMHVQITARYAPASSQYSDIHDQHNVAANTDFEHRCAMPYREISPIRSESRASNETEIKGVSGQIQNFNDNEIKGGHFAHSARSCPVKLIDTAKTISAVSNPVICKASEQAPRRKLHPDDEKIISISCVKLPPDLDDLYKQQLTHNSINPLPVQVTEKSINRTNINFVPRVGVVNVNLCDFNLNESLNWLFQTSDDDKEPTLNSKHDKISNLTETAQPGISALIDKPATIKSFLKPSTPDKQMLYIYLAQTFSIICRTQSQNSANLIRNHQKLKCLNLVPSLTKKAPVPKLVLMPKFFHGKFPIKIPFKIQFRQNINCKLTFSTLAFDKSNSHSQREMSLAPKTDAPDAPGSVASRSAFNYSVYKTHIMKFYFIILTTEIKINNLNLPEIKHLYYHNTNLMIGKLDKPYENDLEFIHTKIGKIRLNGWPPPNMHVKS